MQSPTVNDEGRLRLCDLLACGAHLGGVPRSRVTGILRSSNPWLQDGGV
jgi:hypothetical protein